MFVYMLAGLPGSGKSFQRRLLLEKSPQAVVCCPDDLLIHNGKYVWTQERCANAWAECYRVYEKALAAGQDVIWDATFVNARARKEVLRRAKGRAAVVAVVKTTPFEVCVARNQKRSEDRRVPRDVMERMKDKFQPPTIAEGYFEIVESA